MDGVGAIALTAWMAVSHCSVFAQSVNIKPSNTINVKFHIRYCDSIVDIAQAGRREPLQQEGDRRDIVSGGREFSESWTILHQSFFLNFTSFRLM